MAQESHHYELLYHYSRALSVALGYRDSMTQLHSERVHGLSHELAHCIGLDNESMALLEVASSFHDVGKIGIPDAILRKEGRLSDSEWRIMRQHAEAGENIMAATGLDGAHEVARIIRHHHERFGGNGYPDGIAGAEIPVCARIIGIADSYDAMAVTRSYHRARTHDEVMTVMEAERGDKHDPCLLDHFHDIIEKSRFRAGDGGESGPSA